MKELIEVQRALKAPKGQKNSFGNYNYRSCEDILEAVKPLCVERGLLLTLSDSMILVGDRIYVEATASVSKNGECVQVKAYAREADNKKGMDVSQITGSASSYARKYALNGLFCIDDTKDADTRDNSSEGQESKSIANDTTPKQPFNDFAKDTTELFAYIDKQDWPDAKKAAMKQSASKDPVLKQNILEGKVK